MSLSDSTRSLINNQNSFDESVTNFDATFNYGEVKKEQKQDFVEKNEEEDAEALIKNRSYCLGWLLNVIGSILLFIAVSTPHWHGKTDYYAGLFQKCFEDKCQDIQIFSGQDKNLDLVRVLIVLAVGYIVLATVMSIFQIFPADSAIVMRILAMLHWTAGLALYTYFFHSTMTFRWSYYCAMSATAIYLASLCIILPIQFGTTGKKYRDYNT